jgi:hypothetical protein
MSLAFSQSDIVRFKHKADRVIQKGRAMAEQHAETVGNVITTSEVGASAFLFGLAQGRFGGVMYRNIPIDLLAGVGLHVLAFAGIGGKNASHLHAFGDGALGSFLGGLGRQVGYSLGGSGGTRSLGDVGNGNTGGASLADEELVRMVAAGA